jgi:transcriptional adapter 2-alpha
MIIFWQIIAPVKAQKPMTSQPANHEIAGYMPGRLEFETEYENEAEQSVKDMLFSEEDAPEEVGMCLIALVLVTLHRAIQRNNLSHKSL